ncbi:MULTISPECIES: SDR family oxidoreductase [unclassified Rhizobium]|uniref:SDR family oxidoreductase n=1 Tax=unclassified Rhizobium TaxID=2613769 RepID=UPI001ADC5195|nr:MULTISPECIES: SDR family oxidoreductase [unclassified Rhizobium]MBO9123906.1 SDR family oxidoreductase [Rhizobium sp. 16-488-2b]MBO9174438.1 SDR family oxidoreductase [Rhizobium sp. 16-488-2a]
MTALKVALVTGAGTGIGKAIASALLDDGYHVAITGRRQDVLEKAASEWRDASARVLVVPADISVPADVDHLFSAVREKWGRLDLLVNNAGRSAPSVPLEEVTFDAWNAVVGVNLTGAFLCTQAAFRQMKAQAPQGGRIINNGSISSMTPRPLSAPYTATKHAITGLTKSTALDGRPFNIACGQIDIGNAGTDMTRGMAAGVLQADGRTAVEPTIDVSIVANAVVHMAALPLEANVLTMTVMATGMPFVGRG